MDVVLHSCVEQRNLICAGITGEKTNIFTGSIVSLRVTGATYVLMWNRKDSSTVWVQLLCLWWRNLSCFHHWSKDADIYSTSHTISRRLRRSRAFYMYIYLLWPDKTKDKPMFGPSLKYQPALWAESWQEGGVRAATVSSCVVSANRCCFIRVVNLQHPSSVGLGEDSQVQDRLCRIHVEVALPCC